MLRHIDKMKRLGKAMEVINFQYNSPLAKNLNECFQDVITFRDTLDYTKVPENKRSKYRIEQVINYVNTKFVPKFKDIIKKYVGITANVNAYTEGLSFEFSCSVSGKNIEKFIELISASEGTNSIKSSKEALKLLQDISQNVDTKKSFIKRDIFSEIKKIGLEAAFNIDVCAAFLIVDFGPVQSENDIFTAEELTAIYLHEIGHIFNWLERLGNDYLVIENCNNFLRNDIEKLSGSELVNIMNDDVIPILKNAKNKNIISNEEFTIYEKAIETINYFERKNERDSSEILSIGTLIFSILMRLKTLIFLKLIFVVFDLFSTFILSNVAYALYNSVVKEYNITHSSDNKYSDIYDTMLNVTKSERSADDFAVRHGYGSYLASALNKLSNYKPIYGFEYISNSKFSLFILKAITVFDILLGSSAKNMAMGYIYENNYDRLKKIAQNQIVAFKQADLPKVVINRYINEYENIIKVINDYEKSLDKKAVELGMVYLKKFGFSSTLIAMLLTGHLTEEYTKYQQQLESIQNNKFYYFTNKFNSFIDRL